MQGKTLGLAVFVAVVLAMLGWLAVQVGAIGGGAGAVYEVRLQHAAGLVQNNAVKIAGVGVGRIERVHVDHDVAVLTLRVDRDVVLHTDARALVRAKSLLGEKYLQLDPGTLEAPVLAPGSRVEQVDTPFEIDQVLNALEPILGGEDSFAGAIAPLAQRLDRLLASAEGDGETPPLVTRDELRASIEDVRATLAAARRLTETNEPVVNSALADAQRLLADPRIPKIVGNLERITTAAADDLPQLLARADKALAAVERLGATLDDHRIAKVGEIVDDAHAAADDLRVLSARLRDMGVDLGPLFKDLRTLTARAVGIDEAYVRSFFQKEGVRVFIGNRREADAAFEGLGD
jgi:phospholipid/cholesterol/gamma-HCH transport system substrate-binding protein